MMQDVRQGCVTNTNLKILLNRFQNYDIILNKNPVDIKLEAEHLGKSIFYTEADKRIRLFSLSTQTDSIPMKIGSPIFLWNVSGI